VGVSTTFHTCSDTSIKHKKYNSIKEIKKLWENAWSFDLVVVVIVDGDDDDGSSSMIDGGPDAGGAGDGSR